MKTIHSVLGEIRPEELGNVLSHEHIICVTPMLHNAFGEKWLPMQEVTEKAVLQMKELRRSGIQTIIDGTPIDLGRNVALLRKVSERSGISIIASSGVYYSEDPALGGKPAEQLAQYFIDECNEGLEGTTIRPGILKCATGWRGVTDINRMLLTTMAIVQRETHLPLFAHNEHNQKTPYAQLEVLEKNGANLEQVVIGHSSDSGDADYLEDLLRKGCYLGFDRISDYRYNEQADVMAELIARGWEDRLLVSHDACTYIDFGDQKWKDQKNAPDDKFTLVPRKLLPALRERNVSERQVQKLIADNPRRLLCGE